MSENKDLPESSYPELKLPEEGFKSSIPESLLQNCDPQIRWIMEEISKNTQATTWVCQGLLDTNKQVRRTNGRLLKAESDVKQIKEVAEIQKEQNKAIAPFIKALSQFANLWQYRVFRWMVYLAILTIVLYIYPYFLAHKIELITFFTKFLN